MAVAAVEAVAAEDAVVEDAAVEDVEGDRLLNQQLRIE